MHHPLRRALAASAAGVCLVGAALLTVPPTVNALEQLAFEASSQSYDLAAQSTPAAAALSAAAPERDAYAVTEYTLVQWPVGSGATVSSFFGYRSCAGCSSFHSGIDFTPGAGVPVEAVADGVVVGSTVADGSWGVHVTIEHVVDGVIFRSSYAHLQSGSMPLSLGDTVQRGQVIGRVGNTGQSFGAHLHFTIQDASGTFLNPLPWLREHVNAGD